MNDFIPVAVQRAGELSDTLQKELTDPKPKDIPQTEPKDTLPPNFPGDLPSSPPTETDTSDYKAKYLSLQGKYNAEVPKLTMEIRNLKSQVVSLEEQVSTLLINKNQNAEKGEVLNKEQFEQYGKEFGSLVDEIQQLKKQNADFSAQIDSLQSAPKGTNNHEAYMNGVIDAIARLGANFDIMNIDPVFIGWLKQVPPGDYEDRHAKLKRAEAAMDLPATVEIFKTYLGQIQPPAQDSGGPTLGKKPAANIPNIQPPHTLTGSDVNPNASGDKKVWSRAEILKFHTDQTAGVYRGREAEVAEIDAKIFAAAREGRVSA